VTPVAPLSLSPKASFAELGGEAVVLDLRSGRYFQVNRSGALLLRLLAQGTDRAALEAALATEYRLDAPAARRDVDAWLARLDEGGLLVRGPAPA
jgi:PqqD family protein of HPr-rel-A system